MKRLVLVLCLVAIGTGCQPTRRNNTATGNKVATCSQEVISELLLLRDSMNGAAVQKNIRSAPDGETEIVVSMMLGFSISSLPSQARIRGVLENEEQFIELHGLFFESESFHSPSEQRLATFAGEYCQK